MSESDSKAIFAKKFNLLLQEHHIAQLDIARLLSVSTSTVSTWSLGTRMPRMDKIEQLAEHFGLPKAYFIEDSMDLAARGEVTDSDIKFALFGGTEGVTDEMYEEVKRYAQFVAERRREQKK